MQKNPQIIDVLTEDQRKLQRVKIAALVPFLAVNIAIAAGVVTRGIPGNWAFPLLVINAALFVTTIYLRAPKQPRFSRRFLAAVTLGSIGVIFVIASNFAEGVTGTSLGLFGGLGCLLALAMIRLIEKDGEVNA